MDLNSLIIANIAERGSAKFSPSQEDAYYDARIKAPFWAFRVSNVIVTMCKKITSSKQLSTRDADLKRMQLEAKH